MERTRFIEHRGRKILLLDYSGLRDPSETLREIAKSKELVARQPPDSLLTLTYVRDARYDSSVIQALKDLAAHNKPYVKAAAVVGMSGIHRAVYSTLILFTRRNIKAFDEMEEAKDWLVEQAGGPPS